MELKFGKSEWLFLVVCLFLGVLAEEAFFRGEIGISYIVFIMVLYTAFMLRFQQFSFTHQRFGYLLLICIWLLSLSYFLSDNILFYLLNIVVIPGLVIFHLVVITSPKNVRWNQPVFIVYIVSRLIESLKYNFVFMSIVGKGLNGGDKQSKYLIWKKIVIGVIISIPVLFIVLNLLMAADTQFQRIIGGIPDWFKVINLEDVMRLFVITIYTFGFFAVLQVLLRKHIKVIKQQISIPVIQFDAIIGITVLVIINAVYLLFTAVQFKYFFSSTLQGDLTYAEYARKGFFELLFVTLINLSITVAVIAFTKKSEKLIRRTNQILLTILVVTSGVILWSAFLRLGMYEQAYGFTFTRVLVHSFMIFLGIIFAYTLAKIWLEKLSLFHFYFVSSLIYYTMISVINLNQIVVKENIARYQNSGKIDIDYLNRLSYTGVLGLVDLYEKGEGINNLINVLQARQKEVLHEKKSWQAYNLKQVQAQTALKKLELK